MPEVDDKLRAWLSERNVDELIHPADYDVSRVISLWEREFLLLSV